MCQQLNNNLRVLKDLSDQAERAAQASDFSKAEEHLLSMYEYAKQIYGPEHGEVGAVLMRLVEVCECQGKLQLAAIYLAETEKIVESYVLDSED